MAEIYSSAHKVVAWIGEDSSMQDGKHISELCQVLRYGETETLCGPHHPRRGVFTRNNDALWEVFASRRYFTRLWIVQELVHAGKIKVICSPAEIAFETLLDGMHLAVGTGILWSGARKYIYRSSSALRHHTPSSTVLRCLQLPRSIDDTRTARKRSAPLPDLSRDTKPDRVERPGISCTNFSEVLYELQHLTCSDERDRIYATMSLSNETKTKVAVDYTIDCAQVYYNLAKVIYTDDMLLVAASQHVMGVPRDPDLPSWVPDWRKESHKPQSEADEMLRKPPPLFCSRPFSDMPKQQEKETNGRDFVSFNDSAKRLSIRLLCFGRVLTSDTTHNDGYSYSLHVRDFEPYRSAKGTPRAAETLLKQGDYICQHTYKEHRYPQSTYAVVLRAVDDPGHDVFLLDGPLDMDTVRAVRLVGLVRCVPQGASDALSELKDSDAKHQEFWIV